jgi:hypothetical protein
MREQPKKIRRERRAQRMAAGSSVIHPYAPAMELLPSATS